MDYRGADAAGIIEVGAENGDGSSTRLSPCASMDACRT